MSAVATGVPLASFSCAVSFRPCGWFSVWLPPSLPPPSPGAAEGVGEPVQTDGVVPGELLGVSGALHALSASAGTANTAAAATVFSMAKSLAGDHHDHARRLIGDFGDARLHRRLQQLADLFGGRALACRVAEVHGGGVDVRQLEVA